MLFSWIALSKLQPDAYLSMGSNDFVDISRNPGFLKPLGITSKRAYHPWLIKPRIDVWQEVERRINRDLKGHAHGRSPVLRLTDPGSDLEQTFSFVTRFYRPNILVIEVHLRTPLDVPLREAFRHRPLSEHKAAHAAVDSLVGIIRSGTTRSYSRENPFLARPAMLLKADVPDDEFEGWKESNKSIIANLLINNINYDLASPELANAIFARNRDIDIKFARAGFSLISKQGIVTVHADMPSNFSKYIYEEHQKRVRFLEFALALSEFLAEFSDVRQHNEDVADFLFFLGRPFITESTILPRTRTGSHIWKILSDELGLEINIEAVEENVLKRIDEKSEHFMKIPHDEYDALDFSEKLDVGMRSFHRNWLERSYERHKAIFWIVGVAIAAAGVAARVLVR